MIDFETVLVLTQKEVRDASRNRWFVLFAVAFAVLALGLSWLGLSGVGSSGLSGFGRTGASMINLVLLIVPLMGLVVGAMSLAAERERGSLLYLLAQPVTPLEVLLGKYLGLAVALLTALVAGFGLSGLLIAWQGGANQASDYVVLVGFAFLLALVSLSLGFLISTMVRKTAAAIGVALFVWLTLVFFGDLGLMGTAVVLKLKVGQLLALALLNPLQIFKMAAILTIQSSMEILGPAGLFAVRTYGAGLLPGLVAILVVWTLLPLAGTHLIFKRKGAI